ncbi:uncharacterized protein LOC142242917 [Haematobia irritans]|uniref:uncharacterized protein LOC142242917 n=1 Tax=Haematobia irritans TaxID=7368 RepID=UPI003F50415E
MDSLEKAISEKHRVIVQLNKSGSQNASHSKLTLVQVRARPEMTDSCVALGYNTLQVNKKPSSQISNLTSPKIKLHFDCVGNGFDANTKSEMSSMISQLLLNHHNCCMIRCVANRESSAAVLNHLLVCEVDKRLQTAQLSLSCIQCEYYDIRKFDIVNLLGRPSRAKKFLSTMDLQRWLNGEYQNLVAGCQGHECLDFLFTYADRRRVMYQVKFSYMQIIATKLDSEGKVCLNQCLENITIRPRGSTSMLVDTIRDYYSPDQEMQIWMFFEIPVQHRSSTNGAGDIMDDMLEFAKAAYTGFNTKRMDTCVGVCSEI